MLKKLLLLPIVFWAALHSVSEEMVELWQQSLQRESDPALVQILNYNIGTYFLYNNDLEKADYFFSNIQGPPFYSVNVEELLVLNRGRLVHKKTQQTLSESPIVDIKPLMETIEKQINILESIRLDHFSDEYRIELLILLREQRAFLTSQENRNKYESLLLKDKFSQIREVFQKAEGLVHDVPGIYLVRYLKAQPFLAEIKNQGLFSITKAEDPLIWPNIYKSIAQIVYYDSIQLMQNLLIEIEDGRGLNPYFWNKIQIYLYLGQFLSDGQDPLESLLDTDGLINKLPLIGKESKLAYMIQATDYLLGLYSQFNSFRLTNKRSDLSFFGSVLMFKEAHTNFSKEKIIPDIKSYLWIKKTISSHFQSLLESIHKYKHISPNFMDELNVLWRKLELVLPFFNNMSVNIHSVLKPLGEVLSNRLLPVSKVQDLVLQAYVLWDVKEALNNEFLIFQKEFLVDIADGVFDYLKLLQGLMGKINKKIVPQALEEDVILYPKYYEWIEASLAIFNEDPSGELSNSILMYLLESFDRLNKNIDIASEEEAIKNWIISLEQQIDLINKTRSSREALPNFFVNSELVFSQWLSTHINQYITDGNTKRPLLDAYNVLIRLQGSLEVRKEGVDFLKEEYALVKYYLEKMSNDEETPPNQLNQAPINSQMNKKLSPEEALLKMQQTDQQIDKKNIKSMHVLEKAQW